MSLTVAIQMDPIEGIDIDADSTFALALEAQDRGHELLHYLPDNLSWRDRQVTAKARPLAVRRVAGNHSSFGERRTVDLTSEVDVVLMRQDPPFDMSYITATHVLEQLQPDTLVINDPAQVRNAPEKLFSTGFPGLMPPTLITRDVEEVRGFRDTHRDIIIKPLFGNGGAGVFHVGPGDENLNALLELFGTINREPLIVQRYLPEVRQGDRRIILVDGQAVGAINRVPAEGEEAVETMIEALSGTPEGVAAESADLLYHLLVLWQDAGVDAEQVWAILEQRSGTSGLEERASREQD